MKRLKALVVVLAIASVTMSGCGVVRGERVVSGVPVSSDISDSAPSAAGTARPGAIEVRNVSESEAFTFASTELSTRRVILGQDLVSRGPVVMSFVVPQCAACIAAGPDLAASAAEHPNITFVFVHSGGTEESYETYLQRSGFRQSGLDRNNVVHLDDSPGHLWARFGIIQQPTSLLIAADGSVTQSLGAMSASELQGVAQQLTTA